MNKFISLLLGVCILLSGCNKNNEDYRIPTRKISKEKALEIYDGINEAVNELIDNIKNNTQSFYGSREYLRENNEGISIYLKTGFAINFEANECLKIENIDEIETGNYYKYEEENELLKHYYLPNLECIEYSGDNPKDVNSAAYNWNTITKEIKSSYSILLYLYKEIEIFFNYNSKNIKYYSSKEGELYIEYKYEDMEYNYYFKDYLPKELKNTYYNYDTDFNVSNVLYFSLNAKDFMPNVN